MTTASPSLRSYTADTPTSMSIALPDVCNEMYKADEGITYDVGGNAQPKHPTTRAILEAARSNPEIKMITITPFGVIVRHNRLTPSTVMAIVMAATQ